MVSLGLAQFWFLATVLFLKPVASVPCSHFALAPVCLFQRPRERPVVCLWGLGQVYPLTNYLMNT